MLHKLIFGATTVVLAALFAAPPGSFADDIAEPVAPALSQAHRKYLSTLARRTMRDKTLGRDTYEADYVPAALSDLNVEVVIRLRLDGYLLAEGAGGPAPVAQATRDAALGAVQVLTDNRVIDLGRLHALLLEIEVVGSPEPIPTETDWTRPRAVDPFVEPGVHGVVILGPRSRFRFCPTEIFTSDMVVADALKTLAQSILSDPSQIPKTQLMRFRTDHWYQSTSGADIVALRRGLTMVPPEAVSPSGLDQAITRLAEYMIYRQQETGLFAYLYEAGADRYRDDNNVVRQVGAAAAMAVHANWSGKSASRGATDLALRYHLQGLVDLPDVEHASFIATADQRNKLGVTALLAVALAEHPTPEKHEAVRRKLINGMLSLQRPTGLFVTAFPPAEQVTSQDYFPGEALLAMATHYNHKPDSRVLEAFNRAIRFYRQFFRNRPSPAFVPWQVQAYTIMAQHGKRQDYVDYVFELTDWLADQQLNASNCPWPELWGGIAPYQPGRAGVATAAYLEGFADALTLARESGDTKRARRYESLVRHAARFVMQLQVRPEEAYFIRSPRDAVGGIRTTPSLNLLRIDHCQHALVGLIKARKVLFPDRD